jgi:hypothetical protein
MKEKFTASRKIGAIDVPPPILADSRGKFIVFGRKMEAIVSESGGKVTMTIGDGNVGDIEVELPVGSKIKGAASDAPHDLIEINIVTEES